MYCNKCGTPFEPRDKRIRYCPDCRSIQDKGVYGQLRSDWIKDNPPCKNPNCLQCRPPIFHRDNEGRFLK